MMPVSRGPRRQFLPAFDEQNAGITDFSGSLFLDPEALAEVGFIALTVGEARAGRLGPADAAALQATVDFGFVEAEHGYGFLLPMQAFKTICKNTKLTKMTTNVHGRLKECLG